MRKMLIVLAGALALTGCANNPHMSSGQTSDAEGGALLGGIAGAVIGNQTGSPLAGAAIGAGLGGLAGAAVGSQQPSQPQPGYYAPPPNNPQCPPGDTCYPQPQPPCPAGYSCVPNG